MEELIGGQAFGISESGSEEMLANEGCLLLELSVALPSS